MTSPTDADVEVAAGDILAAALVYASRGMLVLPLHSASGSGCSCGRPDCSSPGKHPRLVNGLSGASGDVDQIEDWWECWPDANIGIRTGAASGIVVLDVDTPKGGTATVDALERAHGPLPATPTVQTGSGGYHLYFTHPGGTVRNSAGRLGDGVDVRGDGGYVVAPPSMHTTGKPYVWMTPLDTTPLTDAPSWLSADATPLTNGSAVSAATAIPEGTRNATLTSLAGRLRRDGLNEAEMLAALLAVNNRRCTPPLPASEVSTIAHSIATYATEARQPTVITVLTARQVCALPDPANSDELLGPAIVRGQRVVLGAHTGHGKTTLALQCVRAAVLGREFLGWQGVGGVRALIIDAEQGLRSIKRRLREARLNDSDLIDYARVPDGLSLDTNQEHIIVVEQILASGDYALVVADPLYKLHSGDSNAEREAVDLMRRLDAWREQSGFALLLPVHCRKPNPGSKFSIHDLFGSSAYVRGAEVVLGLQRLRDGYSKLHFLKDRDGDLPIGAAWGLFFDREQGFRRDPADGKPSTAERLRELRETDPEMTQQQAADALQLSVRTIQRNWHAGPGADQTSLLSDEGT
jgi:hypothetical protein